MTQLEEIYTKWTNDFKFRKAFAADPVKALKEAGFILSAEDFKMITAKLKQGSLQDENLKNRISK